MTTQTVRLGRRPPVLALLWAYLWARRGVAQRAGAALSRSARVLLRGLMLAGALAAFTYAAFLVAAALGFMVAGVCLLVAEWAVRQ